MPTWTTVFNDTFTVSSNTNIADHTPDTGTGWTVDNNQGNPHIDATRDMLEDDWYSTSVSNPHRSHVTDALNDDQAVEAAIYQSNAGYRYGIIARYTHHATVLNGFDGYLLAPRFGVDTRLYRIEYNSGTPVATQLASWNSSGDRLESGDKGRIECDGTNIAYYKNGSLVGSVTDSVITGGGAAFVMGYLSTGMLDNFKAEHVAVTGDTVSPPFAQASTSAHAPTVIAETVLDAGKATSTAQAFSPSLIKERVIAPPAVMANARARPASILINGVPLDGNLISVVTNVVESIVKSVTQRITRHL